MQEIRLELDDAKLSGILMELDILHRAVAPEIVEFYGGLGCIICTVHISSVYAAPPSHRKV